MAGAVAMSHAAAAHVGHRFKAAVRVVGKSADVVIRDVAAESVEEQERIEAALQRLAEQAGELDAGAVRGGFAGDLLFDLAGNLDAFFADAFFGQGRVHGQSLPFRRVPLRGPLPLARSPARPTHCPC